MALRDPIAIYDAANNLEAVLVCDGLIAAGIEAFVVEDVSQAGVWVGGLVPGIHKPQVWVDRADVARAKPILIAFAERAALSRDGHAQRAAGPSIEVVCEECDSRALFPATQRGSVQECPNCGEYLDVGAAELPEGWTDGDGETNETSAE
jgi:hypothetical protein